MLERAIFLTKPFILFFFFFPETCFYDEKRLNCQSKMILIVEFNVRMTSVSAIRTYGGRFMVNSFIDRRDKLTYQWPQTT